MDYSFQNADLTPEPLCIKKTPQQKEPTLRRQFVPKSRMPQSHSLNVKKTRKTRPEKPQPEKPQPPITRNDKRAFTTDGSTGNDALPKASSIQRPASMNEVGKQDPSRQGSLKLRLLNRLASGLSTRRFTEVRTVKPEHREESLKESIPSYPQSFRIPSATLSMFPEYSPLRFEDQQSKFVAIEIAWDLVDSTNTLSSAATRKVPLDVAFVIDNS